MTGDELRAAVANEGNIRERGFEVLATLAERIAMARDDESPEMSEAREIAIRMLDYREVLALRRKCSMRFYAASACFHTWIPSVSEQGTSWPYKRIAHLRCQRTTLCFIACRLTFTDALWMARVLS